MWDDLKYMDRPPASTGKPMAAVLAAIFKDDDGDLRIVMIKRPETMPTHAGHIAFPGGRPDPEDDGPVATALREANEEVGIRADQVEVLGFLPSIDTVETPMLVVPVVARLHPPVQLIPSEREVDRIHTPRLADLADPGSWWSVPWNGWEVWYYDLDGDTLWGATARMVRQLLGLETHRGA